MKPRISLCMIVRNEAHILGRCLESLRGVADEIVVGDTGSDDGSMQLAKNFGATILHLPWQDDFSAARNATLEQASGDWVLVADADDELLAEDAERIRPLTREDEFDGYLFRTISLVGDKESPAEVSSLQLRLFRRSTGARYVGRIHEQLPLSPARVQFIDIRFRHYGYFGDEVARKGKIARNIRILELALHEAADDPFHLFNLATEHVRLGEWARAAALYERALSSVAETASWSPEAYKKLAISLIAMDRLDDADRWLAEGEPLFPGFTDLLYLRGCVDHRMGRLGDALRRFSACREKGDASPIYPSDVGVGTYRASLGSSLVLLELGRPREARLQLLQALHQAPDLLEAYPALVRSLGSEVTATDLARALWPQSTPGVSRARALAKAYLSVGRLEEALSICTDFGVQGAVFGLALLGRRDDAGARRAFRRAVQTGVGSPAGLLLGAMTSANFEGLRLAAASPQVEDIRELLGQLVALRRYGIAKRIADAVLPDPQRGLWLAQILIAAGRPRQAKLQVENLLAKHGYSPSVRHGLAAVYAHLGEWPASARLLADLLHESPWLHSAYLERSEALLQTGRSVLGTTAS